jgi:HEAT repeat protein
VGDYLVAAEAVPSLTSGASRQTPIYATTFYPSTIVWTRRSARVPQVITDMLTDRSDRPEGQGLATASSDGRYHVERQIATDRYYAAHLLGDLRDPRAVPILVPLLKDKEVNSIVPWAFGRIGDKSAVGPLLDALDEGNPSMRVLSIYALETLNAKEALPRLISLLDDHRKSNFGAQVSAAEAAKAAIAKLQ